MIWMNDRQRHAERAAINKGPRAVFDYVIEASHRGGPVGLAEVVRSLERAISTVVSQCEYLESRGLVQLQRFDHGRERTVALTMKGKMLGGVGVPELGITPGGDLMYEQPFDDGSGGPRWLESLRDVIDYQPGDYCLKVVGESMAADGIGDGARVWFHPVEPWDRLQPGTIVHAETQSGDQHKVTLKHFWPDEERAIVRLVPSTPGYPTIEKPADEVLIRGYAYHVQNDLPGGLMAAGARYQAQRVAA